MKTTAKLDVSKNVVAKKENNPKNEEDPKYEHAQNEAQR